VTDGFGSDRANGSLRRGEAAEFDGGGEHREAAASDYNGHLNRTVSLPVSVLPYPLLRQIGLGR
jgi:hypothetical protein